MAEASVSKVTIAKLIISRVDFKLISFGFDIVQIVLYIFIGQK